MAIETLAEARVKLAELNEARIAYKARIAALQTEKASLQARIADINATLQALAASRDQDTAAYKAERDRLLEIIAGYLEPVT